MSTLHPMIDLIDWDDLEWELDPLIGSVDWTALGWGLELSRLPEDSRLTNPNHQLLMLWYRAGTCNVRPTQSKKLQRLVIDWGGAPFDKRVIPGARYPMAIMVPLVDAFIVTQQTRQRPKQAAMRLVRDYEPEQREALHKALTNLSPDRIGGALHGRLKIKNQGQYTLAVCIGEGLEVLMQDIKRHVFEVS